MVRNEYWSSGLFRELMEKAGVSREVVASDTGISLASIYQYGRDGSNTPKIDNIMKIADYFCVPLDFLLGRCDRGTAENILSDYRHCFREIQRGRYETCFLHNKGTGHIEASKLKGVNAPYPYNLLDDIIRPVVRGREEGRWEMPLNQDQEAGLSEAISSLTEREQGMLLAYYEGENTLEQVGKMYDVTRERVRQVIAKAVRKLRHPVRLNQIRYGLEGCKKETEVELRKDMLSKDERTLDEWEEELMHRRLFLEQFADGLNVSSTPKQESVYLLPIEEMDLSVRSFNCLRRAGCYTLGDICDIAREGNLHKLRNVGKKSIEEILSKIMKLCGEDYSELYR